MLIEHSPPLFTRIKVRYLILVYLLLTIGAIVLFLNVNIGLTNSAEIYVAYSISMIACCTWAWQSCRKARINPRDIIGVLPRHIKWLRLIGILAATVLFSAGTAALFIWLIAHINFDYLQTTLRSNQALKVQSSDPLSEKVLTLVATSVVAPITEEFLFRGIILQRWAEKWGVATGLIVSSFLFGILHFNIFGASMFGLIMGLLYIQTKTLWVPIICHALNNFMVFCLSLIPSASSTKSSSLDTDELLAGLKHFWIYGLVMIAISLPFLWRFIHKNFPRRQRA